MEYGVMMANVQETEQATEVRTSTVGVAHLDAMEC
jgi:hypothetical protein